MPAITPNPTPDPTPSAPAPTASPPVLAAPTPPSNPTPDLQDQGLRTKDSPTLTPQSSPTASNNQDPDLQHPGPSTQDSCPLPPSAQCLVPSASPPPFLSLLRSHHFNFLAATATLSEDQLDALADDAQLLTRVQSLSTLAQSCFTLQAIAARSTSLHTLTPLTQSPAPELRRTAEALTRASNLRSLTCHQSAAPTTSASATTSSRRAWCDPATTPTPTHAPSRPDRCERAGVPNSTEPELPLPPPAATPDPTLKPTDVIQTLLKTLTNPDNPASTASTLAAFSTPTTTLNSRYLIPPNAPSPARAILQAAHQPLKLLATTKASRPVDALQLHTYHIDPSGHPTHYASRTIGITLADNTERRLLITLILPHDADPPNAWRLDALTLLPHPPNTS